MDEIKNKFSQLYQETLMEEVRQSQTRVPLTLRLPPDMVAQLNKLASLVCLSRTDVVETLLESAIYEAVVGIMEASSKTDEVPDAVHDFYEKCATEGVKKLLGGKE